MLLRARARCVTIVLRGHRARIGLDLGRQRPPFKGPWLRLSLGSRASKNELRRMKALRILAGPAAMRHVRERGLAPADVGVIPGAAGGPRV